MMAADARPGDGTDPRKIAEAKKKVIEGKDRTITDLFGDGSPKCYLECCTMEQNG
jgi:hypothetical protein